MKGGDGMKDKIFKWILIFGLLTIGVILLFVFGGSDLYMTLLILLILNIVIMLTLSGIFASYLNNKD
jgi:hypothetical protein